MFVMNLRTINIKIKKLKFEIIHNNIILTEELLLKIEGI